MPPPGPRKMKKSSLPQIGPRVLKFWFVHCDRVCPKQRSTNENQEECDKVSLNDPEILAASASKPHQVG
jgi:cytochrome oxidase Cu insertion factor (SCO1/SenC/PrrC family)